MVVKTSIQVIHHKRLFANYDKAEEVLKANLFNGTRKSDNIMDLFQRPFYKVDFRNRVTSNKKTHQVLSSTSLHVVGIYLRDGIFFRKYRNSEYTSNKRNTLRRFLDENYFESYECPPSDKISQYTIKRKAYCFYTENKIQDLTATQSTQNFNRDSYCAFNRW